MASNNDFTPVDMGSSNPPNIHGKDDPKMQNLKNQVNQVSDIMAENIDRILQRGQNLNYLEDRSEMLSSNADEFRISSRRVSRKLWWQNMRLNIIFGAALVVILIIIIWSVTK